MNSLSTPEQAAQWLRSRVTGTLHTDSRKVRAGDGFIAWPGAAADGRNHVAQALAAGAGACLVEQAGVQAYAFDDARIASFEALRAASGPVASVFFDQPSKALSLLAVTGTNGKTSTTWWLSQAFSNLKLSDPIPCGLVGTLGVGRAPRPGEEALSHIISTGLTTPDPVALQANLRRFVDEGLQACAIEASSIGIEEHRLDGAIVRVALFTNLTQDHLDYHGSMAAYGAAKARLFGWPGLQAAVLNVDDAFGAELAQGLQGRGSDVWCISCQGPARLRASEIRYQGEGLRIVVQEQTVQGIEQHTLQTRLIGQYNVSNLLGVLAAMRALGVPLAAAVDACTALAPVPGRMECAGGAGQPLVAVDYAHTPDALEKALMALRSMAQERGGRLGCVFGCGGDRDPAKRSLMGAIAAHHADWAIVTSDNPRSEDPLAILQHVMQGITPPHAVQQQVDRAAAIRTALTQAEAEDVILVAGKGHEDYQEIKGQRLPFLDMAHVTRALAQWRDADGMMSLAQAQAWLPGARWVGDADPCTLRFMRVHTDSRTLVPGDLFVALAGDNFDGRAFLVSARAQGAVAAICSEGAPSEAQTLLRLAGLPGLVVPDSKLALGQLAAQWRAQFTLPLIAVTGSNGKTTVTQMLASVLKAHAPDAYLTTQGNFNNDIGVPLTLLRLRAGHQLAVVELGMNHPGEIAQLAAMARPTVALVNNAQREHMEFMTTVDAVAQENASVISALPEDGVAVFPADDAYAPLWAKLAGVRAQSRFCMKGDDAVVRCLQVEWQGTAWQLSAQTPAGRLECRLPIAGLHNVKNALAAMACALAVGVPLQTIAQGLARFEPVQGRSKAVQRVFQGRNLTVVDDSYNANPDSVCAALHVLAALPAPHLMVLGNMGEVGAQGPQFHHEVGVLAQTLGLEGLYTLGDLAAHSSAACRTGQHFEDMAGLQAAVLAALPRFNSVLVKGARSMQMERVLARISAQTEEQQDTRDAACS